MGYRIYWRGLEIPCKEREYPDDFAWISKKMTRAIEESRKECKEWGELANKLIEKLEQMEKKKNKMTKAEAFEWLKCKKIDANGYSDSVQKKLFSLGVVWCTGDTNVAFSSYLLIDSSGELRHCGLDDIYFKRHCYEEVKAEDILSLKITNDIKGDEDPYWRGRIKDLQEMIEDEEVLIITKTNFLTMRK